MSAQSQVAATLGQVARRLQGGGGDGGGGGEDRPLEGDLPDDGCILALADVATTRLYVVVEAVDGTLQPFGVNVDHVSQLDRWGHECLRR